MNQLFPEYQAISLLKHLMVCMSSNFFIRKINKIKNDVLPSKALLTKIKSIIDDEDYKKPYPDEKIVLILGEQGINIVRRILLNIGEF